MGRTLRDTLPALSGLRDGHKYGFILFIGRVWKEYVGGLVTTRSGEELLGWPKSSFGFPYDIFKKSKQTFWPAHSMAGSLQMGMECKDICAPCD